MAAIPFIVAILFALGLLILMLRVRKRRLEKITTASAEGNQGKTNEISPAADKRKSEAISTLFLNSPPTIQFTIPSVVCALPPWGSRNNSQQLAGNLYFTDRGVAFIQLVGFAPTDKTAEATLGQFGALGGAAIGLDQTSRRKKALREAEAVSDKYQDFKQLMENSKDILFIPRSTISDIRYTWAQGFQINTAGKWQHFVLENSKKTFQQYQPQIERYLEGRVNQ